MQLEWTFCSLDFRNYNMLVHCAANYALSIWCSIMTSLFVCLSFFNASYVQKKKKTPHQSYPICIYISRSPCWASISGWRDGHGRRPTWPARQPLHPPRRPPTTHFEIEAARGDRGDAGCHGVITAVTDLVQGRIFRPIFGVCKAYSPPVNTSLPQVTPLSAFHKPTKP